MARRSHYIGERFALALAPLLMPHAVAMSNQRKVRADPRRRMLERRAHYAEGRARHFPRLRDRASDAFLVADGYVVFGSGMPWIQTTPGTKYYALRVP